MLRGVLRRLAARFRRGQSDGADGSNGDGDERSDEDSRFVPSVLDASVRYAHGQSATGLEREIADVEERARELEDHRDE